MTTSNVIQNSMESSLARSRSPQLSSEGLSSPPRSSPEMAVSPSTQIVHNTISSTPSSINNGVSASEVLGTQAVKPPRRKPTRKSKDPAVNAGGPEPLKPKRIRKPKDPNAPPAQRRKKNPAPTALNETSHHNDSKPTATTSRQPLPSEILPISHAPPAPILPSHIGKPIQSFFTSTPQPSLVTPSQNKPQVQTMRTSGQNYDPIRSSNYDPVRETVTNHNIHQTSHESSAKVNSISYTSTLSKASSTTKDDQVQVPTSQSATNHLFINHDQAKFQKPNGSSKAHVLMNTKKGALLSSDKSETLRPPQHLTGSKKSDSVVPTTASKKSHASAAGVTASPKPTKTKEPKDSNEIHYPVPPPLPGSGHVPNDGTEYRAPTVILKIPMNGEVNKYVNFTRLAEQQYGWDALHPRLAAQRDRLARVAAAGAALERNGSNKDSGDEMSLDSEAEGSNGDAGGVSDGRHGANDKKKVPKKRKMREDEYDKDDGFVDDTELLWEEQAAATNDGFFVYSGPLVPEGEKPVLDTKADGSSKRGRGRGSRGGASRASTGRGANAPTTSAAATTPTLSSNSSGSVANRSSLPVSGPGSRGGPGSRKPRITKADRARMEQEKMEREKAGLAALPTGAKNMSPLAVTSSTGSKLMVSITN